MQGHLFTIFTIGYAGFTEGTLLERLKALGIAAVVDVRSEPHSVRFPDFCKERLERRLPQEGLFYLPFGREFGARQKDPAYLLPGTGYLDFEKFAKSPLFSEGTRRILHGLGKGMSIALLCAEKEPGECHRGVMISRYFHEQGIAVRHLLPLAEKTQADVEAELLAKYFKNEFSLDGKGRLRDAKPMRVMLGLPSLAERTAQAYRMQNLAMGRMAALQRSRHEDDEDESLSPGI